MLRVMLMSFFLAMVERESKRMANLRQAYERQLDALPKGS